MTTLDELISMAGPPDPVCMIKVPFTDRRTVSFVAAEVEYAPLVEAHPRFPKAVDVAVVTTALVPEDTISLFDITFPVKVAVPSDKLMFSLSAPFTHQEAPRAPGPTPMADLAALSATVLSNDTSAGFPVLVRVLLMVTLLAPSAFMTDS